MQRRRQQSGTAHESATSGAQRDDRGEIRRIIRWHSDAIFDVSTVSVRVRLYPVVRMARTRMCPTANGVPVAATEPSTLTQRQRRGQTERLEIELFGRRCPFVLLSPAAATTHTHLPLQRWQRWQQTAMRASDS